MWPFKKAERLNLGDNPCNWEDIKVGEVFGGKGCFNILYKESETEAVLISSDVAWFQDMFIGNILTRTEDALFDKSVCETEYLIKGFYKLPKDTQELFLVPLDASEE